MGLGEGQGLHWISHPLHQTKFPWYEISFVCFVVLCFCLCVCVFVCLVCLFVLLCISIILSEQVNDFAFSGIFEVEESHKELSICPRHRDDFGTRWLCNKKKCSCPSDWAPHGKSSRKGDRGMTLQQSQKLYALTSTLQFQWGSREYTSEFHPDRHLDKR